MENHDNLTLEQKRALGNIHSMNKRIESFIFDFEKSPYKDYEKLAYSIVDYAERRDEYTKAAESLDIPEENVKAFNKGIVTGLINPNRFTYIAYYE